MHGAQDGQKFIGVFLLGMFLAKGQTQSAEVIIPIWLMVLCAAVMGLGTSIGGYRIIKSVGMDMVKLEKYQGFSADLAGVYVFIPFNCQWNTGFDNTYKNNCDYGRRSCKEYQKCQFGHCP